MHIKKRKGWEIQERLVTPESIYLDRRRFLKKLGFAGAGIFGILSGIPGDFVLAKSQGKNSVWRTIPKVQRPYPAKKNQKYSLNKELTPEEIAAAYNNFYEFTLDKDEVWRVAEKFETRPWTIEVTGHVHNKKIFDVDKLVKLIPLEERVYRHRCVEAWSMVVPWTGFAFKKLIDLVEPTSQAQYIRMVSFLRPGQAPGQKQRHYPWPYFEGLTMAEATNELTLLATGIYGHALPNQHGAPIRLITPWKYGFKSIKSIVRIEFTSKQPPTFWNTVSPREYDFWANVNPQVPHPRWSQATERDIGTGKRIPTLTYNGYQRYVTHLYQK